MKRTCLASNNKAIMALNVPCNSRHAYAPWSMTDGVFDTALEGEYTPMLAKALATVVLEAIANEYKLPNVVQYSKRLKFSHFPAIAAAKQPTMAMIMHLVPEFSHVLVLQCFLFQCNCSVVRVYQHTMWRAKVFHPMCR